MTPVSQFLYEQAVLLGIRLFSTWCASCSIDLNSLSSARLTKAAMVETSAEHKPLCFHRRNIESSRERSEAFAKPHQALAAYVSLTTMTVRHLSFTFVKKIVCGFCDVRKMFLYVYLYAIFLCLAVFYFVFVGGD